MITCHHAVLCERVIRDDERQDVTLIGLYEEIGTTDLPARISPLSAFYLTERSSEEERTEVTLTFKLHVNGVLLKEENFEVDYRGKKRNRLTLRLDGMPIEQPGVYIFELFDGPRSLAQAELRVRPPEAASA